MEAARLLVTAERRVQELDRPPISCAIIQFHEYRSFLVESLRLILRTAMDPELDDDLRDFMSGYVGRTFKDDGSKRPRSPTYTQKCITTMSNIEQWLNRLAEQAQKFVAVGQTSSPDHEEIVSLQQRNLTQQHESLGTILAYLVKLNHASLDDLRSLLAQLRFVDRWNSIAVHYVPALISFFNQYGSANGSASHAEARTIHKIILESRESNPWPLRNLQAATTVWWLAEYSSWYFDVPANHIAIEDENAEKEEQARTNALSQALRDGAFQCTLSICSQIKSSDWYDLPRIELIGSLLNDAPILPFESASISPYFREFVMEHFEVFTYALIAHMPDTLRRFKIEEEDERRKLFSGFPSNVSNEPTENSRHLERFFVIMSYANEHRAETAREFWDDHDSNLYGFLQWFSRRVSTPLVGAFCEMFRAISEGEECALGAHQFLIEGSAGASSRIRRSATLSWTQIFEELDFYASKVRETPATNPTTSSSYDGKPKAVDIDEPETPAMLECYLRLVAHLCEQSEEIKAYVGQPKYRMLDITFLLCNNTVPSRIRSCAYSCLRALLSVRTPDVTNNIWVALDQWVSDGFSSGGNIPRPARVANSSTWAEEVTFEAISRRFSEMNSFVLLMTTLISTSMPESELHDSLPFPEQLGSSYRMPGIDPYIDFVLGKVFGTKLQTLDISQSRILSSSVFGFILASLESFNEDLIVLAHKTGIAVDDAIDTSSLLAYVRFHPFSRVVEWMFNEKVVAALFSIAHQDISEISSASADSPLIVTLTRCIRAMNMIMELQSTYLDIVRPLIKTQSSSQRRPVSNPSLASFEDAVSTHLRIIADLAYYSGSGHEELAEVSMELLKKLSMSRKLNNPQSSKIGSQVLTNRLIGILQGNSDIEPISRSMAQSMIFDQRELDEGSTNPRFNTKYAILDFLEQTLSANLGQPNLAHALLGFACSGSSIQVDPTSPFGQQDSLFHAILKLSIEYPQWLDSSMRFWSSTLRSKAARIVYLLWTSTLTSGLVLPELKELDILQIQWGSTDVVDANISWESGTPGDLSFFFQDGSRTFELYVQERRYLYSLAATQYRLASTESNSLWKAQLFSTMLGAATVDGREEPSAAVFDMLDFLELEISDGPTEPETPMLEGIDLSSFVDSENGQQPSYNLKLLDVLMSLKIKHMQKSGGLPDQAAIDMANSDKHDILGCFNGINNSLSLHRERLLALAAWSDFVIVLVRNCSSESSERAALALKALQTISPKLELYATQNRPETHIFATLVQNLVSELDFQSPVLLAGRAGEIASDKLFQLFKISLRAIGNPETDTALHESFYSICYRYLTATVGTSAPSRKQFGTQTIKAAGDSLIDTVCEDAYGAAGTCSIAALLLLDALTRLAIEDNSNYVVESLVRSNFISVLVETIREMPGELSRALASGQTPHTPATHPFHSTLTICSRCRPPTRPLQSQALPPPNHQRHPLRCHPGHERRPLPLCPLLRPLRCRSRSRPR